MSNTLTMPPPRPAADPVTALLARLRVSNDPLVAAWAAKFPDPAPEVSDGRDEHDPA